MGKEKRKANKQKYKETDVKGLKIKGGVLVGIFHNKRRSCGSLVE